MTLHRPPARKTDPADQTELEVLALRSQGDGPHGVYAWSAFKRAGGGDLTAWRAFQAGLAAAAAWIPPQP